MKCPHCGYEDYYQEVVDVGIPRKTETLRGDLGEFYKAEAATMMRWTPSGRHPRVHIFACPSCKKTFIE